MRKDIFYPGVSMMNRLSYLQKFTLIGLVFLVTLGINGYWILSGIDEEIRFTAKEIQGLEYNNRLRVFMEHVQEHRGLTNGYLNGEDSFERQLLIKRREITEDISEIDRLDLLRNAEFHTSGLWQRIRQQWEQLDKLQPRLLEIPDTRFELHTAIISDTLNLIVHVGDTSGLKLDPDHDSYYLADLLLHKLPSMLEAIGQARAVGSGAAARKAMTKEDERKLIVLSGMIDSELKTIRERIGYLNMLNDPVKGGRIEPSFQDMVSATFALQSLLNRELLNANALQIPARDYYDQATLATQAGFRLYDEGTPLLDQLLRGRMQELAFKKRWVMAFAVIVILIMVYLCGSLYKSAVQTAATLKKASHRFVQYGDLTTRVELSAKDEFHTVGRAFNRMVDTFRQMMEERESYEKQIEQHAFYDALTGLPNRVLFVRRLKAALSEVREGQRLAVMFLDVDRFKLINDTLGHDAGDQLLQTLSDRLLRCLPQESTVSRWGGDEFLIILPALRHPNEAHAMAGQVIDQISRPIMVDSHELIVSGSLGISLYPENGADADSLVKNADTAMYSAKQHGKNQYRFYEPEMNCRAEKRLQMEVALRRAVERQELELHYQPRLDLVTGQIIGMEALLRWESPELGKVSPLEFIPLAEETGLIIHVGEWVLRTACRHSLLWPTQEGHPFRVSVNISAAQFHREEFVTVVQQILEETGIPPCRLELELTESIVMNHAEVTIEKLNQLKQLGIRVAIDDFGTGFSSLSYLKAFPLDTIKIDRSFIKDIDKDPKAVAIIKTIIALGRRLQLTVVAEGVETREQLEFLSIRQCNEVQGYYVSRPLPLQDAITLVRGQTALSPPSSS